MISQKFILAIMELSNIDTLYKLSFVTGINYAQMSLYKNGKRTPSFNAMIDIAKKANVDPVAALKRAQEL